MARLETEIARELTRRIGRKPYRADLCDALDGMLEKYTEDGKAALSAKDYVGAQRSVTKAYRIFDMADAVCERRTVRRREMVPFVAHRH